MLYLTMGNGLMGLLIIFFLAFTVFASNVVFRDEINKFARAKEDVNVSTQSSLVFAWPLTLKADGQSTSAISVFVRSESGKPVSNKVITTASTVGVISPQSTVSDKDGKASFQLTSSTKGLADVTVSIENNQINQHVTVKFE